jgi:outer membrane protein insertion porin family
MLKHTPRKLLKFSLFIFLISLAGLNAQPQKTIYKILGISVVGNKSADANTVIANSGLRVGDEISIPGDQTNNAIKHLWNLGIFQDVQILIEKKVDNNVFLLIKIQEYARLEKIVFKGNSDLSEDKLNKKVTIVRGQTIKPQEIARFVSKIKALYDDDGYLNAKITPRYCTFFQSDTVGKEVQVTWRDQKDLSKEFKTTYEIDKTSSLNSVSRIKGRTLLVLDIDEGEEIRIEHIRFNGNLAFDDDKLKGEFDDTKEPRWWRFWSSPKYKKDGFEKDKELLVKFYRKNGYRDFNVLRDSLIYSPDKKHIDVVVDVYEGNQYKLRNLLWEGNSVYPNEALSERLQFKRGDVFDYEKFNQNLHYNEKQSDVSSLYQDNGYLGFQIDAKEEKVSADSIDLHIKISEGNRFKIGKVDIIGNDKTRDNVIRRELYTVPGSYFSRSYILRSIQQLSNLQYFNTEALYKGIDYRPFNDSTVNISYKVEEKSSDYLNASVGYSGSYGFSGSIGFTLTNFSLAHPFQMGAGQILNFNWQFGVGNYYRTFTLGFTEPWFMDTPTSLGADLFDTRQNYVYELQQSGFTLRAGRRLTWPDDFFYISGMFRFQYNNVIYGGGYYEEGLSRQFTLGTTITRTDIDNPIFPARGSKVSLDMELSGGPFLPGSVDYYKIDFKSEWYKTLFKNSRFVLYSSAELGYIGKLKDDTPIQPFEYFYMGGNGLIIATTSLRGYEDRTLGSKNSSGSVVGSSVLAKYTAEFRVALAMEPIPIYLLAFAEAGNVYLDIQHTDLFDLKRSVGIGARILINPIGLVGFDYGYGFDRMSVDGSDPQWLFHFQFGKGF